MEFGNGSMLTQTHELCLLGRQGGVRVRASLGTRFRIQCSYATAANNMLVRVKIPYVLKCRDKNAIHDSTSAFLEHIMLPGMRMAK